jgi:hypothetical protein
MLPNIYFDNLTVKVLQRTMPVLAFLAQLAGPTWAQTSQLTSLLAYNPQRVERLYYVRVQEVSAGRNELIGRGLQALHAQVPAEQVLLQRYAPELGQLAATVSIEVTPFGSIEGDSLRLAFEFSLSAIPGTYKLALEQLTLAGSGMSDSWMAELGIYEPTLEALLKAQQASHDGKRAWVLCQIDTQLGRFVAAITEELERAQPVSFN